MRQGRLVGGRARGGVRVVVFSFATCLPTYRLQYYCTLPRCGMPGTGTVGRDNHEPTALVEPTMGACGRRQATPAGWAGGPGGVGNGESNSTKTTTRHRGPARPSSWSEGPDHRKRAHRPGQVLRAPRRCLTYRIRISGRGDEQLPHRANTLTRAHVSCKPRSHLRAVECGLGRLFVPGGRRGMAWHGMAWHVSRRGQPCCPEDCSRSHLSERQPPA